MQLARRAAALPRSGVRFQLATQSQPGRQAVEKYQASWKHTPRDRSSNGLRTFRRQKHIQRNMRLPLMMPLVPGEDVEDAEERELPLGEGRGDPVELAVVEGADRVEQVLA